MASLVRGLVTWTRNKKDGGQSNDSEITLNDEETSEIPYVLNSIYYLIIITLVGLPMWFYTCSSTRYPLPDLTELEEKLTHSQPRLHLDISVVHLSATNQEGRLEYLRNNLLNQFKTSIDALEYNINWRIRRPTNDENVVVQSLLKDADNPPPTDDQRKTLLNRLEQEFVRIHKSSNRFRLFMFIFEEPLISLVCNYPNDYLINFERFIFLCPGEGHESLLNLINAALRDTYYSTVDPKRLRNILSSKTDLLVSLIPESNTISMRNLSELADKVHAIHEKNIKNRYLELPGILNIRLITQYIFDLLQNNALDKMLKKSGPSKGFQVSVGSNANLTNGNSVVDDDVEKNRYLRIDEMGKFFHDYETRLSKHSSQSVHHVVTIVPDPIKDRLKFSRHDKVESDKDSTSSDVDILEEKDNNFLLIGQSDKSLVLGLRAIVRRVLGLQSPNLCRKCQIRRDVFLNRWELDAIVGALTIMKLQSVLLSLKSISKQSIGIKIPHYVASMVFEAHAKASEAVKNLDKKQSLEAYHAAHSAYELSESAFYDPSLLETLYFPDETKYAIYLPLFLPLALPIAMSVLRLAKYLLFGGSSTPTNRGVSKEKEQ